jgi:hypothetical protein
MVVIRNTRKQKLTLTKDRLAQTGEPNSVMESGTFPRYVLLSEIKRAYKADASYVRICRIFDNLGDDLSFSAKDGVIGCCKFDTKTFARILRAAGIKPKKVVRKRTSGKKK